MSYKSIHLAKGREKSIQRRHPWVFSGAIAKKDDQIVSGDMVSVYERSGDFLAIGMYADSSLSVKILTFQDEQIDAGWISEKINRAFELRQSLGLISEASNVYRLVNGEGDGLAGLIIDVYDSCAVIQPHHPGMDKLLPQIKSALVSIGILSVVVKHLKNNSIDVLTGELNERTRVLENGLQYNVDIKGGQKTGFFIDQRENRALVGLHAKDKDVLNAFSYTGGFSMSALGGGAKSAISLDASQAALDIAEENAQLNGFEAQHNVLKMDAVKYLSSTEDRYDCIVLDPPAFAKHKSARHNAIQAYRRINESALNIIKPGGFLFTFSCSQVVDRQMFRDTVLSAAINAGREVQILKHLQQPEDHPVSIFHPEGSYLKGMMLRIL